MNWGVTLHEYISFFYAILAGSLFIPPGRDKYSPLTVIRVREKSLPGPWTFQSIANDMPANYAFYRFKAFGFE